MATKIGLIVRANDRGLGIQSWEFYRHLKPYRTVVVCLAGDNEALLSRFPDAYVCKGQVHDHDYSHFEGCSVVLSFETFYNDRAVENARLDLAKPPKFLLQPNYEQQNNAELADGLIIPSVWHFNDWKGRKAYLPVPIDRERLAFRQRTKAEHFVHNAGTQLGDDRNGTTVLLKAMPLVKSSIRLTVRIQKLNEKLYNEVVQLAKADPRVTLDTRTFSNYWELWGEGDVFIYPRAYGGLALPTNEAMSVGMPVLMSGLNPQNEYLPSECLIPVSGLHTVKMFKPVEAGIVSPLEVANKIDEFANKDISALSEKMNEIAHQWSWEKLLPKYLTLFKQYADN